MQHLKGNFDYEERGILDKTHLKFFDKNRAFALFESAGYYIKSIFRIKNEVSKVYVRDVLNELGLDASQKAVDNIRSMLDFEVFQYFVTALPANEKNALQLSRSKEADYIAQIKEIKEQLFVLKEDNEDKTEDIRALKEKVQLLENINRHHKDLESAYEGQKEHIANLGKVLFSKEEYISELNAKIQELYVQKIGLTSKVEGLNAQLQKIYDETKEL